MSASELVRDVELLIAKYSYDDVVKAAKLVKSFASKPVITDSDGSVQLVNNLQVEDKITSTHVYFDYPWFITMSFKDVSTINNFLKEGQLISAIKKVREVTGLGLKEAKDLVELRFK